MDTPQTWESVLTLAEQQLVVVARVLVAKPRFAFLDKPSSTLGPEQVTWVLSLFRERSITCVTFEERPVNLELYDRMLELKGMGDWTACPIESGQIAKENVGMAF
jgi:putative ATP-binding cassette transporter